MLLDIRSSADPMATPKTEAEREKITLSHEHNEKGRCGGGRLEGSKGERET